MTHDEQRAQLRKELGDFKISCNGCQEECRRKNLLWLCPRLVDQLIDLLDPLVVMKDENQENLMIIGFDPGYKEKSAVVAFPDKDVFRTFRVKE